MITKPRTVPELRFPGFDEKWKETPLGKLADLYQPKTISQTDLTTEGYTVYGANGVIGKYHSFNHEKPQIAVTCRGSTCGLVNFTEPHSWITGNAMVVNLDERPNETKRFVYHALNATDLRYLITGSGQPQITGNLKGHEIGIPALPEQRKIAEFLTAVDGRIGQLSQKKALLEDYKKGVMQQLFTQALRFKDDHGNEFPEWEEKTLGAISKCYSGGTPSSGKRDYYGGSIPFIRSAEIAADSTALFLTEKGLKESAAKMVEAGDLLVALYGANSGEVGISKVTGAINQAILCVRTKQSVRFLYFWLEFSKQSIVNTYLQGGQGNLSGKILQALNIEIPSLPEQTKIANFLTALDRKLESVSRQITHTQAFKKGLLQQMFV